MTSLYAKTKSMVFGCLEAISSMLSSKEHKNDRKLEVVYAWSGG